MVKKRFFFGVLLLFLLLLFGFNSTPIASMCSALNPGADENEIPSSKRCGGKEWVLGGPCYPNGSNC